MTPARGPTGTVTTQDVLRLPEETPLLAMGRAWVKPEGSQPSGSVKYRLVHALLARALEAGEVPAGVPLVEVSSGATGVALATCARAVGRLAEVHVLDGISAARLARLHELGAHTVVYPAATPVWALVELLRARAAAGKAWHLDQYCRARLVRAYADLAREVVGQLRDAEAIPTRFVCAVGTGGLIQAVGGALRQSFPRMEIVALEPDVGCSIEGLRNTDLCHSGADDPYDRSFPDQRVLVGPPRRRWTTPGGPAFGESASACLELVQRQGWRGCLVVAPD